MPHTFQLVSTDGETFETSEQRRQPGDNDDRARESVLPGGLGDCVDVRLIVIPEEPWRDPER